MSSAHPPPRDSRGSASDTDPSRRARRRPGPAEDRPALVTTGSGFLGGHVARALVSAGRRVRCLLPPDLPEPRRRELEELGLELIQGRPTEPTAVRHALVGCREVYHCAEIYRLGAPDPEELYHVNVQGTRVVLDACAEAGVRRVVHGSKVGAMGPPPPGGLLDESASASLEDVVGHYQRSKLLAERAVREHVERGLPVVTVNPTAYVGEGDAGPTPMGRLVLDFLSRRVPAYVDAGRNVVDVRDVARGFVLAAERGRPGERYILGARNLDLRDILELLARVTGLPAPRIRLPHAVPLAVAAVESLRTAVTGGRPRVSLEAARVARTKMFVDCDKAMRELGFSPGPVEPALRRAVAWFREAGYLETWGEE